MEVEKTLNKSLKTDVHESRKSYRKSAHLQNGLHAANSSLLLHPELLDEVLKYVWIPEDVREAYRNHQNASYQIIYGLLSKEMR